MRVHQVRGGHLVMGQVAIVVLALLGALVLGFGPSEPSEVLGGRFAAVGLLAGAVFLVRSLRRQAVVVDGRRLGWRSGLRMRASGWTDLADVRLVTNALSTISPRSGRRDLILWAREGGQRGLGAALMRRQMPKELRRQKSTRALRPFHLPMSSLDDDGVRDLTALLRTAGLRAL